MAEPSMLMVAPKGRTKLAIFGETPRFFSVHFIDTGKVPELLHVLNATKMASDMPRKNLSGLTRANVQTAEEYTTPICRICLLYTSDAADEEDSVDLGGR